MTTVFYGVKMKQLIVPISALMTSCLLISCGDKQDKTATNVLPSFADVVLIADQATTTNTGAEGFSTPINGMSNEQLLQHLTGDALFESQFVTAPNAEHPMFDGLGPVFNNQDCNSCHQRDGRATAIQFDSPESITQLGNDAGIFLRISLDDGECDYPREDNNFCKNMPVPGYGTQLFHRGVLQARSDWQQNPFLGQAQVSATVEQITVNYPDGEAVVLTKPVFIIEKPYDAESFQDSQLGQSGVRFSPRIGLPIHGLGLLELIPQDQILALEDPLDKNNDGILGRANWVFDPIKAQQGDESPISLGRFGWKASTPSVRVQSLGALRGDMGITNPLFPEESIAGTPLHEDYLARTGFIDTGVDENGELESNQQMSDDIVFYAETLAVPARRNVNDPTVQQGAIFFEQIGCSTCHHPDFVTSNEANAMIGGKKAPDALKNQHIYPFTDMLLHDMGDGLADNRRDFMATGREWKTRPLWGIGLTKTVNPLANFLHDGRAETLEQAILWHGGEAEKSKNAFMQLAKNERQAVISFLESL
jgi:CxxC motif-containing protein (DUF1111 family)